MSGAIVVVVNPRSAGGSTSRRMHELEAAARRVFGEVAWRVTERPGHATELARDAVISGADRVIAVGGDGTANEVVNGLFDGERPRRPECVFALVPSGTGGDLAKTLRSPRDPAEAFAFARDRVPVASDVLSIRCVGHDGAPVHRLGINVTGFGINGEVVARANRGSKRFGGTATFLAATVSAFATWRPPEVQVSWVDHEGAPGTWRGQLSSGIVANAQYCGGGMWVGRGGSLCDGLADLLVVPQLPTLRAIVEGRRLFSGTLGDVKEVSRKRVASMEAIASPGFRVLIDVDGEQPGLLPISIVVLPRALLIAGQFE